MDAREALDQLRVARLRLFEASQEREALVKRRRPPLRLVEEANERIAELRDAVEAARVKVENVFAALSGD